MKKANRIIILVVAALVGFSLCVPVAAAADVPVATKQKKPASHTVVRAAGVGKPPKHMKGARGKMMARRAAEVRAVRNLARKLGLRGRARIRGFRYALTEYRADGSVKVVVEYRIPTPRKRTGSPKKPGRKAVPSW